MKKVVIALLVIVGIVLLAPLGLGFYIKHKYQQLYQLATDSNLPVTLKIVDYTQGWFSSDAIVQVTLEAPTHSETTSITQKIKNYQFEVPQKIYHGPIILTAPHPFKKTDRQITFALASSDIIFNQADIQLDVLTTVHYLGDSTVNISCPHITDTIDPDRSWHFALQGLNGELLINRAITEISGDFNLASFDIQMKESAQHFKKMRFTYHITKDQLNLWHGERDLSIDTLSSSAKATDQLAAQGVKLGLYDKSINNKFSSTISASIANVKLDNKDFGSQEIKFRVADMDAKALNTLGARAAEFDNKQVTNDLMFLELYPLLLDLLNKGFSVEIAPLAFNTSWGAINGKLNLMIAPSKTSVGNLEALLDNLTLDAEIKFPAVLLSDALTTRYQNLTPSVRSAPLDPKLQASEDIKRWILAGWLVADNDKFAVKLNFKGNQLQINGKMLKIPLLPLPGTPATTH